jgi:acyl dehydratase
VNNAVPHSLTFDELLGSAGRDLGKTPWHRIKQADVIQFAELTHDRQWIHLDEERARSGPFGTTVAHGLFTLSLAPFFVDQLLEVRQISMGVNYGLDRVRFPAIVPVGAQVRAGAVIVSVDASKPDRAAATLRLTFECDASERPVCVADLIAVFFH